MHGDDEDLPDWGLKKPEDTNEATSHEGMHSKNLEVLDNKD